MRDVCQLLQSGGWKSRVASNKDEGSSKTCKPRDIPYSSNCPAFTQRGLLGDGIELDATGSKVAK